MLPLNYAILKYYTTIEDACATDVIAALKGQSGRFKALSRPAVIEALMTAEKNGLLEETRCELNDQDELEVYYRANAEGKATINKYIK